LDLDEENLKTIAENFNTTEMEIKKYIDDNTENKKTISEDLWANKLKNSIYEGFKITNILSPSAMFENFEKRLSLKNYIIYNKMLSSNVKNKSSFLNMDEFSAEMKYWVSGLENSCSKDNMENCLSMLFGLYSLCKNFVIVENLPKESDISEDYRPRLTYNEKIDKILVEQIVRTKVEREKLDFLNNRSRILVNNGSEKNEKS
jgi:hypothetical protein